MKLTLIAVVVLLVATACGGAGSSGPIGSPVSPALPAHAKVGRPQVSSSPTASQDACHPTESLRPAGSLPAPGHMPAGSTMARILARGHLVAGVDQTIDFFGFRDPITGQVEGFDIDMVHLLAKAIFGDPSRVQLKVLTSAQRIPALRSGAVDIIADQLTMTCARWQQVDFSTDYFMDGQRVMVHKGSVITGPADLGGRRVCAPTGTLNLQQVANFPSHPVPVGVDNWTDCLVLLQQHQVDAVSTDDGILLGLMAQDPNTEMVGPRINPEPHGLAISQQSPDFVRFVNGVLAQIRADGTWKAEYNRWLASHLGPAPAPPAAAYRN